jgi:hypothetical protein
VDSRLRVAGDHSSAKSAVGRFLFDLEFPDPVSEEPELLFHRFLARGAAHRGGVRAAQGKRHGGRNDIGRSGGDGTGTGGIFGVGGGRHEGSRRLFVNVRRIILIISRIM